MSEHHGVSSFFKWTKCGKIFINHEHLTLHLQRDHSIVNTVSCSVFNEVHMNKADLDHHIAANHTTNQAWNEARSEVMDPENHNVNYIACSVCHSSFGNGSDLDIHIALMHHQPPIYSDFYPAITPNLFIHEVCENWVLKGMRMWDGKTDKSTVPHKAQIFTIVSHSMKIPLFTIQLPCRNQRHHAGRIVVMVDSYL